MKQYALLVLLLLAAGCGQAPDYREIASEFQSHKNDGNVDRLPELFADDGAFVYNYANGEKVLALLRQWRGQ